MVAILCTREAPVPAPLQSDGRDLSQLEDAPVPANTPLPTASLPCSGCSQPEISSSLSSGKCWLLRCSHVGGVYFFRVTYWRPIVFLAFFTRFLESVLEPKKKLRPADTTSRTCMTTAQRGQKSSP